MLRQLKPILETASTVLVILAAAALLWQLNRQPRPPQPPAPVQQVAGLSLPASSVRHVRGTGSVVLVEFADYECPFCGRHANTVAQDIHRELVESGQVQQIFLNFPLPSHPRAQKAGEAAECAAEQDRFWDMHKQLFNEPRALDLTDLFAHASTVGLDTDAFAECLNDSVTAERVRLDVEQGRRLGVRSTPIFFVGVRTADGDITLLKRISGALPFETFREAIADVAPAGSGAREGRRGL